MVASSFGRGEKIRRGLHCTLSFRSGELEALDSSAQRPSCSPAEDGGVHRPLHLSELHDSAGYPS